MFDTQVYVDRRQRLMSLMPNEGHIVLLGNGESPMNYTDNPYPFRQDSTFLYFTGLDRPDLALVLDLAEGTATLYGHEPTLDHVIWMGEQPGLGELAAAAGIDRTADLSRLSEDLNHAQHALHWLPPYRADNRQLLSEALQQSPTAINAGRSEALIRAVVALRSHKDEYELAEMDRAVNVSGLLHRKAMQMTLPGKTEALLVGLIEGIAAGAGCRLSYPPIVSVDGQILHNHRHDQVMGEGRLLLGDFGVETTRHYAGDITRTFPVSGRFTDQQRDIYTIVLRALEETTAALRPGLAYRSAHLAAATIIADGLKQLGLMQGDTEEAVAAGAHALFFPHGLGHMIGLDVHDMEDLGEDFVGYGGEWERSTQFGLRSLRLARPLETGFTLTVEPGIYFIPVLIDQWQAEGLHRDFIRYDRLADYRGFGGIRIEDNVLITEDTHRLLGEPIPKTVEELELIHA